jgi:hypothetical protein
MTYRVIFLFGIGDLYQSIENAARTYLRFQDTPKSLDAIIEWWFRYQFQRHLHIDLTPHLLDTQSIGLESGFLNATNTQADVLYSQVIWTIYAHRMQCFQCVCDVTVSSSELSLIFHVDSSDNPSG